MTTKEQVHLIMNREILKLSAENISIDLIKMLNNISMSIDTEVTEPQVKQLEWNDEKYDYLHTESYGIGYSILGWRDMKPVIEYHIWEDGEDTICINLNYIKIEVPKDIKTMLQAKAYAQEHFEGLIRGCMV